MARRRSRKKLELVSGAAANWLANLTGRPLDWDDRSAFTPAIGGIGDAALWAAIDTALFDLEAQAREVPLHDLLGGLRRNKIGLYANTNRATRDRSPDGFVRTTQRALEHGFQMFKIAPFDDVSSDHATGARFTKALDIGLARIDATRAAIGDGAKLRVDCHWRFTPREHARC